MPPTPGEAALQQIKPRSIRSQRALKARESQIVENPKQTVFLNYTTVSQILLLAVADISALKKPFLRRFTKKNDIHPFEDPSSLEFFSLKNDAALFVFSSHTKKRPHMLTLVRMFEHKVLDMLELMIDPNTFRNIIQFKNTRTAATGLKPMLSFSGTPFENPVSNEYTLAKSLLTDLFRGQDTDTVDVEGLQYIIAFSAEEDLRTDVATGTPLSRPRIHMRTYLIKTKRSGSRLPRVDVEEMGPRIDFWVGRSRAADDSVMKEALKKPRGSEPRAKKNVTTDLIGDKVGRIHIGKQDLKNLQLRKMKGLKRARDEANGDANEKRQRMDQS